VFWTTPLTFGSFDAIAGCGGAAPGIVTSEGSDHMQEAYTGWTLAHCKLPGATGAATRASLNGEGQAVKDFESGDTDLAYTSAGDNPTLNLSGTGTSGGRSAVATPVALNAAVVAVGGGFINGFGEKSPYSDLRLKPQDVAALFTGGNSWVLRDDKPYKASILGDNPQLGNNMFAAVPVSRPLAPAESESSTWYLTDYLSKFAPADWVVPFTTTARGATAAPALADPPFAAGTIDLFSGRPPLNKIIGQNSASLTNGPIWVLTDLQTAKALHLTPVAIQNGDGTYVTPTAESMAAAVPTMKPGTDGMLLPDPEQSTAAAAADGAPKSAAVVEPYPLTFVEYAYAPAEPLVDTSTCTARASSQALLTSWLQYVTGPGQTNLPTGFQPLPASLSAVAQAQIPLVGASPVTGTCAGKVTTQGATGGAANGPNGTFPVSGVGGPSGVKVPTVNGTSAGTDATVAGAASNATKTLVAVPAFAGRKIISTTGSIFALLGIVVVTSLAAWITAGGDLGGASPGAATTPLTPKRMGSIALLWCAVAAAGIGLVVFQLGPLLAQRDQRALLQDYRREVNHAAHEQGTLAGLHARASTDPPEIGSPVGIIEIGALQTQDVVVEGVGPSQTSEAPGHVPGTAGIGQPGNAVVVARRNGYGASFRGLDELRKGDRIVATTTQGQSVYSVTKVGVTSIGDAAAESTTSPSGTSAPTTTSASTPTSTAAATTTSAVTTTTPVAAASSSRHSKTATFASATKLDALYGPSSNDRLTLLTSGSRLPWNTSQAVVVEATLLSKPFAPTTQGARSSSQTGMSGQSGAWQGVLLASMAFAAVVVGSVFLYRRLRFRTAYVLTIAPLVALTVIVGESVTHLFPAWM
jgi:sortase A